LQRKLKKAGFEDFKVFEGDLRNLNNPQSTYFQEIESNNKPYEYLQLFNKNPLPENFSQNFIYFSNFYTDEDFSKIKEIFYFPENKNELDEMNFVLLKNEKKLKKEKLLLQNPIKSFLFKLSDFAKAIIDSDKGYLLNVLMIYFYEKFKKSITKKSNAMTEMSFEYENKRNKEIEIPDFVNKLISNYKNKQKKIVRYEGYKQMNDSRLIGNCVIKNTLSRDACLDSAVLCNPLHSVIFNLQIGNLKSDYNYDVLERALHNLHSPDGLK
jgi:hypothetical protein